MSYRIKILFGGLKVYNKFKDHFPIADQNGADLVLDTARSLAALRDAIASGNFEGWNYTNGALNGLGTYSQPSRMSYTKTIDAVIHEIRASVTSWNNFGALVINWTYVSNGITLVIGTETTSWVTSTGRGSGSSWSGSATVELFVYNRPSNDLIQVLETVDFIRENLMSVRDAAISGISGVGYSYSMNYGLSSSEIIPEIVFWIKGTTQIMKGVFTTASNESVTSIAWSTSDDGGTNYLNVGLESFVYDSDFNCTSSTWSALSGSYVQFQNNKPIITDQNPAIINTTRENVNAVHDGSVIRAMPFWNYSISGGTNSNPVYVFHKNGNDWIRTTQTYGTSGPSKNCISQQIYQYSSNSGTSYVSMGTVNYAYIEDGIVSTAIWI